MSLSKLEEIKCPCGEVFEAELWNAIHVSKDPDLKEALLSGEINIVCCTACNQIFYAEHFLLYQDPQSEILAFVHPTSFSHQAAHWHKKMKDDFKNALDQLESNEHPPYEPILLFGMDSLVELIREDDAESDEASILEYMAKDLGLSLIHLHPALARPKQLPKILPKADVKGAGLREEVLEGIEKIIKHNEHLTRYKKLHHKITQDKKWHLSRELVRK